MSLGLGVDLTGARLGHRMGLRLGARLGDVIGLGLGGKGWGGWGWGSNEGFNFHSSKILRQKRNKKEGERRRNGGWVGRQRVAGDRRKRAWVRRRRRGWGACDWSQARATAKAKIAAAASATKGEVQQRGPATPPRKAPNSSRMITPTPALDEFDY
ncbi:hypothetical protein Pyn_13608 [Prunus yedoensis var. nudiflora]|uniref:Uncharacterized protein n=1 Tax=Prunus yedoensis var. nudiflora TaxID=2094558 RepID=A0A314ZEK1_PRUYE|nr:hypothetical protein Pyn_13608 [Prunus yedoensis var. nudiflora]